VEVAQLGDLVEPCAPVVIGYTVAAHAPRAPSAAAAPTPAPRSPDAHARIDERLTDHPAALEPLVSGTVLRYNAGDYAGAGASAGDLVARVDERESTWRKRVRVPASDAPAIARRNCDGLTGGDHAVADADRHLPDRRLTVVRSRPTLKPSGRDPPFSRPGAERAAQREPAWADAPQAASRQRARGKTPQADGITGPSPACSTAASLETP
jgi:hypothetical protein